MKIPKINIPGSWVTKIANEFRVSHNTVRISLRYALNSETGVKIRERAIEMLIEESKKSATYEYED